MVSEQINFNYEIPAGQGVRLAHRNKKEGKLTGGLFHFPDGCNGVVQVRILISAPTLGGIRQITPINNDFISLNDAAWEFTLEEQLKKNDEILVDMQNNGAEAHTISVVVTRWSDQPTQTELDVEEIETRLKEQKEERRWLRR